MYFYINTRCLFPTLTMTCIYNNSVKKIAYPIARGRWIFRNDGVVNGFSAKLINSTTYVNDFQRSNHIENKDKLKEILLYSDSFSKPLNMYLSVDKLSTNNNTLLENTLFDYHSDTLTLLKLYLINNK